MTTAPTPPRPPQPAPGPALGPHPRDAGAGPGGPPSAPIRLPRGVDPIALLTVVRITVARQNRGLRRLVLAAMFALPIVFAVLIRRYQTPYRPASVEGSLIFGLIFPALVPLAALLLASGMVQDDVEEQTLTYLLIRPIPRWAIYIAKLAGTVLVSWVRAAIFTIGTLVAVYWGNERLMGLVLRERAVIVAALLALALSAYSAIFGGLSLWVRRTLVVGAIYIVGFEMIFGSIDFVIRELTVIYYIRVLAVRWLDLSGADWSIDPATAVSASTCVIVLLGITFVFSAIGAITFNSREFRVKTPEGN
jgi:ABC-2 type transport system permease protein